MAKPKNLFKTPLEKAKENLNHWKKVKSKEIENERNVPEESLDEMIAYFEEKIELLNTTFNLKKV